MIPPALGDVIIPGMHENHSERVYFAREHELLEDKQEVMAMTTDNGNQPEGAADAWNEGRDDYFMDIDRMVNEGLGGGYVSPQNGLIDETTTDTIVPEQKG